MKQQHSRQTVRAIPSRRVVSLWLPNFSIDRANFTRVSGARPENGETPQVTVIKDHNALRVAAAGPRAQAAGIFPGMPLTDARALEPALRVDEADPAADLRFLAQLADWCGQYSPWTAPEAGGDAGESGRGVWLDVSGCTHLFGGEAALLDSLVARIGRLGFDSCAGLADTPGAAWAVVRYGLRNGDRTAIVKPGRARDAIRNLPVAALRFSPDMCAGLERLGLRRAGDLFDLPRGPLVARFGDILIRRVDQALGRIPEPISPQDAAPRYRARLSFAEPVAKTEDVETACKHLLKMLCRDLERACRGLRRLELAYYRVDGSVGRLAVGTSQATRNAPHLLRLLREHFGSIDSGFGIEAAVVDAVQTQQLFSDQLDLAESRPRGDDSAQTMASLVDRLANKAGHRNVRCFRPRASYLPERSVEAVPFAQTGRGGQKEPPWFVNRPRPVSLFDAPEPIEVVAPVPDDPPVLFRWRRVLHRVAAADGPERIAPEWWDPAAPRNMPLVPRDYYRVEDDHGCRFWLYRDGLYDESGQSAAEPKWYLHGLFA